MDQLTAAIRHLQARAKDVRVRMIPGLAEDLQALGNAFEIVERRTALLAEVVLRKHYWPGATLRRHHIDGLAACGVTAETARREAEHGKSCCCSECLPIG